MSRPALGEELPRLPSTLRLRSDGGRHAVTAALRSRELQTDGRCAVAAFPWDWVPAGARSRARPRRLEAADAQTQVPRGVTARAWAGMPTQEAMGCASQLSGTPAPGGMTPVAARLWRRTWSGPAARLPRDPGAGNDEKSGSCPLPRAPHAEPAALAHLKRVPVSLTASCRTAKLSGAPPECQHRPTTLLGASA
jgi:hypothetical protein